MEVVRPGIDRNRFLAMVLVKAYIGSFVAYRFPHQYAYMVNVLLFRLIIA